VSDFGFFSFLAVAGVCFLVTGHTYRNRVVVTCQEPLSDSLVKILPASSTRIGFPSPAMMDRDFIDLLFARIEPPMLNVEVFPP